MIGGCAAFCTTVSYFPQLKKCWETGESGDLSLLMFSVLTIGIALWIFYGFLKSDPVIIIANSISFTLLLGNPLLQAPRTHGSQSETQAGPRLINEAVPRARMPVEPG